MYIYIYVCNLISRSVDNDKISPEDKPLEPGDLFFSPFPPTVSYYIHIRTRDFAPEIRSESSALTTPLQ